MTSSGVKFTVNRDSRHMKGSNLITTHEKDMNLQNYHFNHPSVISEESTRNGELRSQTTDRGPSRKLRSKGRQFGIVSSHQKTRPVHNKNPVESSCEFDVDMPFDHEEDFDLDAGYKF